MSNIVDAYVGEIRMFAGAYAPEGWAECDGSLVNISDNQVLYSLIGVTWGGDGVRNFALPDLRGRLPIGQGAGANLTPRTLAQSGGTESVPLDANSIPVHTHSFNTLATAATTGTLVADGGGVGAGTLAYAQGSAGVKTYMNGATTSPAPTAVQLSDSSVTNAGGGQPHSNVMPSFVVNYVICTSGLYPDRP